MDSAFGMGIAGCVLALVARDVLAGLWNFIVWALS